MGRSRSREASCVASWRDWPRSRSRLANSTIRIEFLQASPTSTTSPICTKMFTELSLLVGRFRTPTTEHNRHSGTTRITASGRDQLSYSAARARKTQATASPKTYIAVLPARICMEHQFGPLFAHRERQRLPGRLVDRGDRLARADSRLDGAHHGGGRVEIVAIDENGAADLTHIGQRAHADHLPLAVPHLQEVDVGHFVAELPVGLNGHLPVASEDVEAINVERAEIDLQRLVNVLQRNPQRSHLGPVHVQIELRGGGAELRGNAHQRPLFLQGVDEGLSSDGPAPATPSRRGPRP